eukprot:9234637-Pyramimonas_sp.AAC.1
MIIPIHLLALGWVNIEKIGWLHHGVGKGPFSPMGSTGVQNVHDRNTKVDTPTQQVKPPTATAWKRDHPIPIRCAFSRIETEIARVPERVSHKPA